MNADQAQDLYNAMRDAMDADDIALCGLLREADPVMFERALADAFEKAHDL